MTNTNEITIFDEIVNCGILENESVINFGAGHQDGKFLDTLREYNGNLGENLVTAVEPDPKKIRVLSKKFKNENISLEETTIQNYLEDNSKKHDWVVITGIFDNYLYGEKQYEFVSNICKFALDSSNKGVIFSIKETLSENFKYSMLYFFVDFSNTYKRFTLKKFKDDDYIFCIFKQ